MVGSSSLFALQSVSLEWSPSVDPNVTGYNVYYGVASRTYTNQVDAGMATNVTINGLVEGVTYYFAATAYNILGVESDYSDEVSYSVPGAGNQAPTLNAITGMTINEDAAQQTVALSGISSGATNEVQTLTVTATSSNTGLIPNPSVTYTSPNATGNLAFTPVANANGSAVITVTVNDGQAANNTIVRTFTVTVNAVNDAPTLNAITGLTINEDAGLQTVALSGIGSGAANESQTLTVTATSSNTGLIPNPSVTYTSPNATGSLAFTPVANANGSAVITVTVNDGQAANNTIVRTFTVTVNAVNDTPTLNALGNVTLNQNAGLQTVNLSGISSGAANESQTLVVTATSSNTGLIPNPTVHYTSASATGTLTFTPVAGVSGSAIITATVNDGSASSNTISRTFTVTVNATPFITAIPNQTIGVNSNSGPVGFVISDKETAASSLTLSAASSATVLIPVGNIVFGGSGSNRTVTLTPVAGQTGTANITISVSDGVSSSNSVFQLNVLGVPTPPGNLTLMIVTNGAGAVSASASVPSMVEGKTYTLTAVPAPGNEFAGWSGSISSASPKVSFTMTSNLVLQANFVPSPYIPANGSYSGLFYEDDQVRLGSSGCFTVVVTSRGTYSGRLQVGTGKYSFSGKLALDCRATNSIVRKLATPLVLNLEVKTNGLNGRITGQLTDGSWIATLQGDRAVFGKTNAAPFAGNYTMVIPGQDGDTSEPEGDGYGTVRVNAIGKVLFSGMLADGTKITQSATLSQNGAWPLYAALYSGKGLVVSWMNFTNRSGDDLNGALNWIKSANALAKLYPGGFNVEAEAVGSTFAPVIGTNVLNASAAQLKFSGGNLPAEFTNILQIAGNNKIANLSSNQLSLSISPKTGTFKGKVLDPSTGRSFGFGGVVLQKLNTGYGFLTGTNLTSRVLLASELP